MTGAGVNACKPMETVAIVGVGLIGGSFGLALRESGFSGDLIGVSSHSAIEAGIRAGSITRSANLAEAAAVADLIYLAQPVDRILITLEQLKALARPGTVVTDAGSTKQAIVEKAASCLPAVHFIGGHPLAGKEQRGAAAAEAHLFRNRPYILTPHRPETPASANLRSWLIRIGARIVEMTPSEHDSTVAVTSHLPQILSTALAITLAQQHERRVFEVFGPGLIDMTRLAMSGPDLWKSILSTNKPAVRAAIADYSEVLRHLQVCLENDNLVELFEIGSGWARQLRQFDAGT